MIKITKKKVNVLLLFSIIMLSLQTISWHHELKQLHTKLSKVLQEYNNLVAHNKQLLINQSSDISGAEVKEKAINTLHMRLPKVDEDRPWRSEVQYIELPK
jgi:cell division protein FtsL